MPKNLSDVQVKHLTKVGNFRVAPSLYLKIENKRLFTKSDRLTKKWYVRKQINQIRRWSYVGTYPAMSPSVAKKKAIILLGGEVAPQEILREAKEKKKSSSIKEAAKGTTFAELTSQYINEIKRPAWTSNGRSEQGWRNTLNEYILPVIGHLEVEAITPTHMVKILSPLWLTKHETASRSRSRVENIIDYGIAKEISDKRNPAKFKNLLENLLPHYKGKVRHHPALSYDDLPAYTSKLWGKKEASHSALKLILLTQVRSEDARGALWTDFNLQNGEWKSPIGKLDGELHKLPIPSRLLWELQERAEFAKDERVFPGDAKNKFITSNALVKSMRSFGFTDYKNDLITIHGFRSTFTDWVMATSAGLREDTDRQLAHREENQVLSAYWRSDLYDRRVKIVQDYEDFAFSDIAFSSH